MAWMSRQVIAGVAALMIWLLATPVLAGNDHIVTLPADVAKMLRDQNRGDRDGCGESRIFIHDFYHLGTAADEAILFLGAPDYLCGTNSFLSAIVSERGQWRIGTVGDDGLNAPFLPGEPVLFRYSETAGYVVVSEWSSEAPINFLHHSRDGVVWSSVELPPYDSKLIEFDCCFAPQVVRLCVNGSGQVYMTYAESENFHGGTWGSSVEALSSVDDNWYRVPALPSDASCDLAGPGEWVSPTMRERREKGAVVELRPGWSVRIPGLTSGPNARQEAEAEDIAVR
ncbi:MAG: hypothetical protein AAFQ62_15760 [Pseudomonadota bacterium]